MTYQKCLRCKKEALSGKTTCGECKEKQKIKAERIRKERRESGQCVSCGESARPGILRCEQCSDRLNRREVKRHVGNKISVLSRYGKLGELQCCWEGCEVVDVDMLTLDHINDNGHSHRKEYSKSGKGGGTVLYKLLIRTGFPEGFQTLCANHNLKKHISRLRGT